MTTALTEVAATIWADTRPRTHDCEQCDQLARTIERLLTIQNIEQDQPPEPDTIQRIRYEPVPEPIRWIIDKHPNLWWLATLPTSERDWYRRNAFHSAGLMSEYPNVTNLEWQLVFDETLRKETA